MQQLGARGENARPRLTTAGRVRGTATAAGERVGETFAREIGSKNARAAIQPQRAKRPDASAEFGGTSDGEREEDEGQLREEGDEKNARALPPAAN